MLVKPNFDIFKAKFDNPQWAFEWFCYLLFCKEYEQPYGIHRYKNQSGIETDPIEVGDEVVGWQSKFYESKLSDHEKDLINTLEKTKRDYPNITKIIFYTNVEWTKSHKDKNKEAEKTQVQIRVEKRADELKIEPLWRTEYHFESDFVLKQCQYISRYFFEWDVKWELTDLGFQDLLYRHYTDKLQTISFLINDNQKAIEDIYINLAIIEDKKEEQDNKKLTSRESFLSSYEEIHKPKEPIAVEELLTKSKKSLIYGKAGIGKTTLCKYIAYKWSQGELYQEFDYVVYIVLREWKNGGLKGAIKDNYYSQDEDNIEFDIQFNSSKTLFLFDGYDELVEEKKKLLRDEIDKVSLSHYIITSRPYGYQRNDFRVDEHFETIGFTDENVQSYIEKFFENDGEQQQRLNAFLETNISIKHIAYIPLMLEMICTLWQDKVQSNESLSSPMTMTELYGDVVEYILEKHAGKKEDTSVYEWENREDIKELLGKIAFEALQKQNVLFDGKFVRDTIGRDKIDFFKTSIVNSGFLKSDRKDKSLLGNNFEFLHLTFQEYFVAYYVNTLSQNEQKEIIREYKFYPHMQMFFAFWAGLIEDKEFLLEEIESEPRDVLSYYKTIFILNILSEINKSKLNELRIKSINNDFIYWTTHTLFYYGDEHQVILKKLKGVKPCISKKTIDALVPIYKNFIKEEEIDSWYRGKAAEALVYFDKNDNIFIKELQELKSYLNQNVNDNKYVQGKISKVINLITKENIRVVQKHFPSFIKKNDIDFKLKEEIFKLLSSSEKNYSENLATLVNLIKNESNKNEVVNTLFLFNRKDDEFILILLKLIENQTIKFYSRKKMAELLSSLNRSDSKFVKMIIKFIKVETIDSEIRAIVANSLVYTTNNDNKVVNALIKFIHNTFDEVSKGRVAISLASLGRSDNKVVNSIIKFIKSDTTDSWIKIDVVIALAKLFSDNISIFRKIDITEYYPILFVKEISIESFFEAYDNNYVRFGYINSSMIIENAIYNKLPLYIRDNKLHTVKNGKEIRTKRDVDEEFLIGLNSLLGRFV